ncbi:hypothetical protein AM588_10010213 [Phytophthora nicotianae]|uniref:Uncharacterized protein n=1 Tax=Phytophthora nicotianae TaxID=4792 RepID=A0A0W8DFF6_PHYNI|nr:hypothetical protein AM588_10010213 [Phytophthora nicotianae]
MQLARYAIVCSLALWWTAIVAATNATTYPTRSGIRTWVDPDTPEDRYVYTSSRGRRWDLVMSDEFNVPNRSFRAGDDHMWTSLEKPDGVNGALELYSHNMTSTRCDDDGTCYFYIKTVDEVNVIHVYNMYTHPPSFEDVYFWYRGAMVQSWNKFCYQGGMLEVRAQLPGAVTAESGNPTEHLERVEVAGKAFCKTSDDCTIGGTLSRTALKTGKCVKQRCECLYHSWGGPRCTTAISGSSSSDTGMMSKTYGPPMEASIALAVVACLLSATSVYMAIKKSARQSKVAMAALDAERKAAANAESGPVSETSSNRGSHLAAVSKDNYRQNFV